MSTGRRIAMGTVTSAGVLATAGRAAAQGCAMCGSALSPDDPISQAFNWSILFLIAMPYTLFTLAAVWLWVAHRRAASGRRASVIRFPVVPGPPVSAGGPKEV
jgi:hypothetical protein